MPAPIENLRMAQAAILSAGGIEELRIAFMAHRSIGYANLLRLFLGISPEKLKDCIHGPSQQGTGMKIFLGIWGDGYGGDVVPVTEVMNENEIRARYDLIEVAILTGLEIGESMPLMDNGFHVVVRLGDK
jgi:hypothetical protein